MDAWHDLGKSGTLLGLKVIIIRDIGGLCTVEVADTIIIYCRPLLHFGLATCRPIGLYTATARKANVNVNVATNHMKETIIY